MPSDGILEKVVSMHESQGGSDKLIKTMQFFCGTVASFFEAKCVQEASAVSVASQLLARGAIFLATPPAISAVVSSRALCLLQQRWLSAGDSHVRHVVWFRYGPTDSRAIGFGQIAVGWRACGTCALSAHPPAKRGACRAWSVRDHTFPNSRENIWPSAFGTNVAAPSPHNMLHRERRLTTPAPLPRLLNRPNAARLGSCLGTTPAATARWCSWKT